MYCTDILRPRWMYGVWIALVLCAKRYDYYGIGYSRWLWASFLVYGKADNANTYHNSVVSTSLSLAIPFENF